MVSESDEDEEGEPSSCPCLRRLFMCRFLRSFFVFFFLDSEDLCLRFLSSELRCFLFFFEWCDLFLSFLLLSPESESDDLLLLRDDEEAETRRSCFRL